MNEVVYIRVNELEKNTDAGPAQGNSLFLGGEGGLAEKAHIDVNHYLTKEGA